MVFNFTLKTIEGEATGSIEAKSQEEARNKLRKMYERKIYNEEKGDTQIVVTDLSLVEA